MNKADEFAKVSEFCLNATLDSTNNSLRFYTDKDRAIVIAEISSTMIRELFRFYNDHGTWPNGLIESLN